MFKQYLDVLKSVPLFHGMQEYELVDMLQCLQATIRSFRKGDTIILAGDKLTSVGIIIKGNVQIVKEDFLGNKTIMAELTQTDLFAESFACSGLDESPISVLALVESKIMFVDFRCIITTCNSACIFHTKLIENMVKLLARKNLILREKTDLLSQRTIREKIMYYFDSVIKKTGSTSFTIPFNRNELSDYLCVDRSALSRELCKMRDEGLLEFYKNEFTVYRH